MIEIKCGSNGLGFASVLTLIFVVLKLMGQISWSWWWVLSPLWISALLSIALIIIGLIVVFIWKIMQ